MTPAEVAALPECPILPPIDGLPAALGMMYVLEGSTLGGRYITRAVGANLGLRPGDGCSYFASYGDRVGPMWKEFGRTLEAFAAAHPAAEGRVVAAAAATFAAFERWVAGGAA